MQGEHSPIVLISCKNNITVFQFFVGFGDVYYSGAAMWIVDSVQHVVNDMVQLICCTWQPRISQLQPRQQPPASSQTSFQGTAEDCGADSDGMAAYKRPCSYVVNIIKGMTK